MASGSFPPPPGGEPPQGQSPGSFPPPPGSSGGDQGWGNQGQGWDQGQSWDQSQGWGDQGGAAPAWSQSGPQGFGAPPSRTNGTALAAMICGIISVVCLLLFFLVITIPVALLTALAALVTGVIGLRASREPGVGGRGQAIAGIATGGLTLLLIAVVSLFAITAWQSLDFESNPFTDPEGFFSELEERGIDVDEETGEIDLDELQRQLEEDAGTDG